MADDMAEAEDERAIELTTIAAIYPELVLDPSDSFTATIDIPIEPIKPLVFLFEAHVDTDASTGLPTPPDSNGKTPSSFEADDPDLRPQVTANDSREYHELSHLPPVTLRVHLPAGYPDEVSPDVHLTTEVPWLPKALLSNLEKAGIDLWEETGRSQMLFAFIDHLRDAAENGFNLASGQPLTLSRDLEVVLLDFDIKAKRAVFERATFECGVCLEPKKGVACHRMTQCGHVFCVECLQDFYNNCITEGDIGGVKCIAPKCGHDGNLGLATPTTTGIRKKRRRRDKTLEPSELLQIPLEPEIVQRYVKLKRKQALESDQTTVYCPRQFCQGPARSKKTEALDRGIEDDSDDDDKPIDVAANGAKPVDEPIPPAERLAICVECTFAFCKVCKASWHGEFVICDPKRKGELTAEEKASEEYIKLHTSPCPTCNAKCQKTHGCNHMICFKCSSHFCYLCSSWLDAGNPYEHFNNPKKPCFLRLWELEAGDGDDVGRGFAGGFEESDDDGQDDNPFDELSDVDSEDEAEPLRPPIAPPEPRRRNRRARNIVVRLPPPRVQAAIERRAAAAPPVPVNGAVRGRAHPEARAVLENLVNGRPVQVPPGIVRRRPIDGIQRFLDMAQNDEEDGWDSDELDDGNESDGEWQIPFR